MSPAFWSNITFYITLLYEKMLSYWWGMRQRTEQGICGVVGGYRIHTFPRTLTLDTGPWFKVHSCGFEVAFGELCLGWLQAGADLAKGAAGAAATGDEDEGYGDHQDEGDEQPLQIIVAPALVAF